MLITSQTHPVYRPDIDGLRAIAVLTVVAYHAFPQWFKGGFIGVDIFFTISGYLISTIIYKNLEHESFSFIDFYSRRIRRIFPALILVLIASYSFGWFVLLPHEFKQLGGHIAAGAGFISNFLLWNESGYFDNAADTKPLLHLWSLGIEEQFYIFWPCLLWLACKARINWLLLVIIIGATSFALNIKQVRVDEVATFYSPQTRVWELLIGAGLAYLIQYPPKLSLNLLNKTTHLISKSVLNNCVTLVGIMAIVIGLLLIQKGRHFPGVWPLLPGGGAALIILAGQQTWINQNILSNRLLVWVGLISFPLYLWHWPLLAFARIVETGVPTIEIRLYLIVLSFGLAWFTFQVIEKPFRFGSNPRIKTTLLLLTMIGVGLIGYYTYSNNGLNFRGPKISGKKAGNDGGYTVEMSNDCGLSPIDKNKFICMNDSRGGIKYALIGDSKAEAILSGLVRTSHENARWLAIVKGSQATPVPVISENPMYREYQPAIALALDAIIANEDIKDVVLVTATRNLFQLKNDTDIEDLKDSPLYEAALEGLQNTIDRLKQANKKITIVVDNPTLPHPEDCFIRVTSSSWINSIISNSLNKKCQLNIEDHLELSEKYRKLLTEVKSRNPESVKIFDTVPIMCDTEAGICSTKENGKLLYVFTDHISDYAAGKIGKALNKYLEIDDGKYGSTE